jgi:phosphoribosyl 1,2-cyclic phosphate phosphodiesterase
MRITFLGTSAANAFPEAFCSCANCEQARKLGGDSLRKRSSILINDDLLIDLGPDIMSSAQQHSCPLTKVRYCLQTHPHADHLDLSHLLSRSPEYGTRGAPCLHIFASPETLRRAAMTFEQNLADFPLLSPKTEKRLNMKIHPIGPHKRISFGQYRVVAFPANHDPENGAYVFLVEERGRTLLYAADTASLPESTWQGLCNFGVHLDIAILDHTYGPDQDGSDHLAARQVIEHMIRMKSEGILKESGCVFATHIAHEGNPAHPDLVLFARQHRYEVAYDGLRLEI